ncbi:unnamed protein product, partial [Prunus brigantina]
MTEQPKKEISIKMPGNDKPLAAIIEGRWYAVGKSGRPTMELTRTQKRRIQRQYCTFLSNENNVQILPETNSARKGKEPEKPPQAEQAVFHSQKMLKTKSPDKLHVHLTSSSDKQLEASQVEGEPEPIPAEKQEDWIEENEEEQLDYEPSTDDQNAHLGMEGQEDWTEEYGEEQMEYDGELDTETEVFGAELEGLLQGDLGINMVFILSEKFWAAEGQESTLEGDVFSQESFECRLAEAEETSEQQGDNPKAGRTTNKSATEQLCFSKPTKEMANHLRPLFITANFGGVPVPKVMVDGGAAINLLPYRMLSKMGRTEKDLIPTRLTVTNFAGGITKTHGILDVDVIVGSKELKIAFFVVDTTSTTYNALLGRDWIHQSLCVPSTLHQQLALWNEEGYMEIVEADPRPFLPSAMCFEARYYHDDLGPFTFLGVNQNGRPHGVTAQRLIEDGLASSLEDWNRPFVLKLQNSDERKLFMQDPAINMAEFTHESTEDQEEEELQEEVLDFAPAALDDSLPEVEDPLQEINLGTEEDPRPTFISALLKEPIKGELIALLQEFRDCFAWHYHEMPGLDRELVEHKLPIKDGYLPVKQARRRMSMDTELKDEYPMPMADMLVDGAAHNQMLSFMDGNAGNFLGFLVHQRGIEIDKNKAKSIIEALPPRNKKELQSLLGKINFLRRFISNSAGKIQPFSSLLRLKQEHTFKWEEQHQQAFEEIKRYLSNPPVLSPPKRGRPLKLYISASEVSIGSLLVQDNKEGKEQAIYYLSRTLTEVERKYSAIERLCLALYFTAVKLRHYMLPYTIYIIAKTDLIKYMLTRPMLRGRIGKWTLALTEFAFRYVP